ncbi:3-hydroxyacyl-CoA dehydrogenase family protein [Paraburkholderia strydomiana]|jgi:3-hydroxybutyryl-CoA dehydrogenase|uniref:3-hydroxyacyl-CoA dehydrogenase family protein n=1 Tax=Paraburkholderia strydomiana TaxID=1245417 RepID=A0ABW9EQS4_9BURK
MNYSIKRTGDSRSFPDQHAFVDGASAQGDCLVYLGDDAGKQFVRDGETPQSGAIVAIELKDECLGVYTESTGTTPEAREAVKRVFGFARFQLGNAAPTQLVEIVTPRDYDETALKKLKSCFENAGLVVAVCNDFPGRIVNRLVRPYYNAVLRRYDEKLATAEDLDTTLKMGLGYPEGPLALLSRTGLAEHADTSLALYEQLGDPSYLPARSAMNALRARNHHK